MKEHNLGEFEEIVLLAVGVLKGEGYGVSIKKEIETRGERSVSVGALQSSLIRLEEKGYIKTAEGEKTQERAGRPKKYYQITAYGQSALEYKKSVRTRFWEAMPNIQLKIQ